MFSVLYTARMAFTRWLLFDRPEQDIFLTVLSAQLRNGRTRSAIFSEMQTDPSRHVRELARRATDQRAEYFAENFGDYFGQERAAMLTLAQRHNSETDFIDHMLAAEEPVPFWRETVFELWANWAILLLLLGVTASLYIFNPEISAAFIDLSGTELYALGAFIVENAVLLAAGGAGAALLYLAVRGGDVPLREPLARRGFFRFHDAAHAIAWLTTFRILTGSAAAGGRQLNMPVLMAEIAAAFSRDRHHRHQFGIVRSAMAGGSTLRDALAQTSLLPDPELRLFRGLTPTGTLEEHHAAAAAVVDQLEGKTRIGLKSARFFATIFLNAANGIIIVLAMGLLMGSGLNLLDATGI